MRKGRCSAVMEPKHLAPAGEATGSYVPYYCRLPYLTGLLRYPQYPDISIGKKDVDVIK